MWDPALGDSCSTPTSRRWRSSWRSARGSRSAMAELSTAHSVLYHRPKAHAVEAEWEDRGGYGTLADGTARNVVVDGATEAYDTQRWVDQLVSSFLGEKGCPPELSPDGLDRWIDEMQQRWLGEAPARFASIYEERKFRDDGSFA